MTTMLVKIQKQLHAAQLRSTVNDEFLTVFDASQEDVLHALPFVPHTQTCRGENHTVIIDTFFGAADFIARIMPKRVQLKHRMICTAAELRANMQQHCTHMHTFPVEVDSWNAVYCAQTADVWIPALALQCIDCSKMLE